MDPPKCSIIYLASQWPIIMGYFELVMGCFGIQWPVILGYLAFHVLHSSIGVQNWGFCLLDPPRALGLEASGLHVRWAGVRAPYRKPIDALS